VFGTYAGGAEASGQWRSAAKRKAAWDASSDAARTTKKQLVTNNGIKARRTIGNGT